MQVTVHLTAISNNKKVGKIPVSTTSANTCPPTCPLKGAGCYADHGPLGIHWKKVSSGERGMSWEDFCDEVSRFRRGTLWRHNQAGDLPHNNGEIDTDMLEKLVMANKKHNGFTYTHHNLSLGDNKIAIEWANDNGFTVNVSTDNISQVPGIIRQGLPVVTILPLDAPNVQTVDGVKVVACPAEKSVKVDCQKCGLCAIHDRSYAIGFRAHGTRKKKVDIIAKG